MKKRTRTIPRSRPDREANDFDVRLGDRTVLYVRNLGFETTRAEGKTIVRLSAEVYRGLKPV